ncbi:MAG: T9SS type A sorting domain-containing protein [Mariniphaga sp.]|jgi:hypothetical protein|nr:T9SS type A sorting domain-containing protein [Mariniphaga sp.]
MRKLVLSLTLVIATLILSAQSYSEYKFPEEGNNYYDGKGYYLENENVKTASIQYFNFNNNNKVKSEIKFSKPEILEKTDKNQRQQKGGKDFYHVTLRFDITASGIIMTSDSHSTGSFSWSEQHKVAEINVPEGIYDISIDACDFMNTEDMLYVFLHNLNVSTDIDTTINLTESANHYIYFHGMDENNEILSSEDTTLLYNVKHISIEFPSPLVFQVADGFLLDNPHDYVRFSDVDTSYKISFGQVNVRQGKMYVLNLGHLNGISDDTILESFPDTYKKTSLVFYDSPSAIDDYLTFSQGCISRLRDDPYYCMYSSFGTESNNYPSNDQDTLTIYLSNIFNTTNLSNLIGEVSFWENLPGYGAPAKKITTKPFYVTPEDNIQFWHFYPPTKADYAVPNNSVVNFGNTTPFVNTYSVNSGTSIFSYSTVMGQSNDTRSLDDYSSLYYIKQGNDILQSDTLFNFIQPYTIPSAGPFSFSIVDNNYFVNETQGELQVQTNFNMGDDDPNPPTLTSFKILDSYNLICNSFESDKQAYVHFSAADFINNEVNNVNGAYLYYKKHDEESWTSLPVVEKFEFYDSIFQYGQYFVSDLSPALSAYSDSTFLIDLKLILIDAFNNVTREIFHPAFFVRNQNNVGIIEENLQNKVNFSIFPNPAIDNIAISLNGSGSGLVEMTIFDIQGRVVSEKSFTVKTNMDVSNYKAGIYYVRITGHNLSETRKLVIK